MQYHLKRTDPGDPDFAPLIALLDQNLKSNDGDEHAFFAQHNKTDTVRHAIVAYENGIAVATGAFKHHDATTAEIKRMFVRPESRSKGIASAVLAELENWAKELGYMRCILETGVKQAEAVRLYPKLGYVRIAKYPPYERSESSICMAKPL